MSLIEIEHVSKTFKGRSGDIVANDDVSLRIDEGKVFGIFGHNGAGKTTIVNQLLGLIQPDSGSIVVSGEDIVRDRRRGRYLCSIQPQGSVPLGELTPRAVTRIMAKLRGASNAEVVRKTNELFERLDIAAWADQPGNKLSGGILRLTGFCMAAICPGRVVVLDEPTNDVDPVRRRLLWSAIRDLTRDGTSVLLVTHSISEAEGAVDEMAILDKGRVLVQGNAAKIKAKTVGDRMKLEAVTTASRPTFRAPDWVDHVEVVEGHLTLSFSSNRAVEALGWASELQKVNVLDGYSLRQMSLEDVYIQLVGEKKTCSEEVVRHAG
ncbi:ABC-type multidrug transport system, ATPase component [Corynebacterium mustelae]|uniref:ABC-type multidrug transport system, ATPase component n=1 Tax=Corynebacterium mustelae TaxID=571915 RepID=A0A0G3GV46_9CORY|nr:ABC transporter ATP-binding protein [Corynebacterium mustelae]AKK05056.1 ABC-type multidrug transport system, ATPase component [Corynebacterium mustelae]